MTEDPVPWGSALSRAYLLGNPGAVLHDPFKTANQIDGRRKGEGRLAFDFRLALP